MLRKLLTPYRLRIGLVGVRNESICRFCGRTVESRFGSIAKSGKMWLVLKSSALGDFRFPLYSSFMGDDVQPSISRKLGMNPEPRFLLFKLPRAKRFEVRMGDEVGSRDSGSDVPVMDKIECFALAIFCLLRPERLFIVMGFSEVDWKIPATDGSIGQSSSFNRFIANF